MAVLTFIATYWFELLIGCILLGAIGTSIYKFSKLPIDKKYSRIRAWLLYAVTQAEKDWGSGTGPIKLSQVYNMFVARYPFIKTFISLETFDALVDSALKEMRELLKKEEVVAAVAGTPEVKPTEVK